MENGSESESVSARQYSREVLQGVTRNPHKQTLRIDCEIAPRHNYFNVGERSDHRTMDYNELKVRVLRLFEPAKELHSLEVHQLLGREKSLTLTDKAVEMALMRYWRQGLLSRVRRGGRFQYTLTERGAARRDWLLKNKRT